jgi:hypothetical protein
MKGDIRCVSGTLWRHDPQYDDPDHEVSRGTCPECRGEFRNPDTIALLTALVEREQ